MGLRVRIAVFADGERMPLLIGTNGIPHFEATVYCLTELRTRNVAAKTIEAFLRSLVVLISFLDSRHIDLAERIRADKLLDMGEVEDLVRHCRVPVEHVHGTKFVQSRMVQPDTASIRLRNIRDYLTWLAKIKMRDIDAMPARVNALAATIKLSEEQINARISSGRRYTSTPREGLAPEELQQVLAITDPRSSANPWETGYCRVRNALLIAWLAFLGPRRGEILGIRVSDIDFRNGTVAIRRRPDDVRDTRRDQPNAKTLGRLLPVSDPLLDSTRDYVLGHRAAILGARAHDFLFVASRTGEPLSIPSLNKICRTLNGACPGTGQRLCPHVFRHTWNERFSEAMDRRDVPEEDEKRQRAYLMGWANPETAATYLRRKVRLKAQAASLRVQAEVLGRTVSDCVSQN